MGFLHRGHVNYICEVNLSCHLAFNTENSKFIQPFLRHRTSDKVFDDVVNLLNERSADATVTGRVTEDSQGHARVLKYLNKVKSSHRYRLKIFLTKLISDKFGRVCQLSIKRVLSVVLTSDCNRGPLVGPGAVALATTTPSRRS